MARSVLLNKEAAIRWTTADAKGSEHVQPLVFKYLGEVSCPLRVGIVAHRTYHVVRNWRSVGGFSTLTENGSMPQT